MEFLFESEKKKKGGDALRSFIVLYDMEKEYQQQSEKGGETNECKIKKQFFSKREGN